MVLLHRWQRWQWQTTIIMTYQFLTETESKNVNHKPRFHYVGPNIISVEVVCKMLEIMRNIHNCGCENICVSENPRAVVQTMDSYNWLLRDLTRTSTQQSYWLLEQRWSRYMGPTRLFYCQHVTSEVGPPLLHPSSLSHFLHQLQTSIREVKKKIKKHLDGLSPQWGGGGLGPSPLFTFFFYF